MKYVLRALLASLAFAHLPVQAGTYADLQVISRSTGQRLPIYAHGGKLYVAGQPGERYSVQVTNRSPGRVLAVISVDGVNVVSGETAAPEQSGYVLSPYQSYDISGWRKTNSEVAAFYFTALPDSYAARTDRPGNVGVIGLALFREWTPPRPRPQPVPRSFESESAAPQSDTFARRAEESQARSQEAPAAPSASADANAARDAARAPARAMPQQPREKLGTGHGEREYSAITYTDFRRASAYPTEVLTLHYDRYENLVARGIVPGTPRHAEPQPFPGRPQFVPDPRG